jgi:hypothetical protein
LGRIGIFTPRANLSRELGEPLSPQGFGRFLDHLSDRNISLVRLRVDEIQSISPQADVELMISARRLTLAAS